MAGRFLSGLTKDKNLEQHRKGSAHATIANDEIGEEKEREGMYPNELDDEMQNYKYGDKLYPQWNYYGGYGGYGGNNTWGGGAGYYNNPWLYGSSNYMDYWNNQNTFAPPFDPDSHFKSPYYHYDDKYNWWGGYSEGKTGYW